jgi:hypothetical protein
MKLFSVIFSNLLILFSIIIKASMYRYHHAGAKGERKLGSNSLLTSALDVGEWSASRPGRALPPVKEPPVPIVLEAGWAPESVRTQRLEEK